MTSKAHYGAKMSVTRRVLLAVAVILIAAALRFEKLGAWPFAGDELATVAEARSLFDQGAANNSQIYRLARAIPLSSLLHRADYEVFGADEFGSRVIVALLGSFNVGLVFWFLQLQRGWSVALSTSLVVLLWPEHVFQSQQNRFYMIAAFVSFLSLLLGAAYSQRRRPIDLVGAFGFGLLAVLAHTLTVVVLATITTGIFLASRRERHPLPALFFGSVAVSGVLVLALFGWYLLPLLRGWNPDASWGYSPARAALASVSMLGWPVALCTCLGFVLMMTSKNAQDTYWIVATLGFSAATLLSPMVLAFHPAYVFPLALGPLVLAGTFVSKVFETIRPISTAAAYLWMGFLPAVQVPSLISHFADGSRSDYRTAAAYVQSHWTARARVTGFSMGTFSYYAPRCVPALPLSASNSTAELSYLTSEPGSGPLWVVLQSGRSGLDPALQAWLNEHCQRRLEVRKTRLDYYEFRAEVYLCGGETLRRPTE